MLTEFKSEVIKNELNIYGIVVIKDGVKIAEHHFIPEERRELFSVTKSFTSTAVGIAITAEKNAVITVMADFENDTEEMRQCIWNTIYPRL